jgi:alpha-galactosidase
MGWNGYNTYACNPTEDLIVSNPKGLVRHGLDKLGYEYVTADCGWYSVKRDAKTGALEWNSTSFPSGGEGLGEKIHELGLKFGVYSGAGYWQCSSGGVHQGSLGIYVFYGIHIHQLFIYLLMRVRPGYEEADAKAFARWGADPLKYVHSVSLVILRQQFT